MSVPASARREVFERAGNRCEYCGLSQEYQEARFQIDHVIPVSVGGRGILNNLAVACVSCSLRKGARLCAPDPATGNEAPLFHPRREVWEHHFRWDGVRVLGLTPTGRATVAALGMNRPLILAIRREEAARSRHPGSTSKL
jgi:hypothetical protein